MLAIVRFSANTVAVDAPNTLVEYNRPIRSLTGAMTSPFDLTGRVALVTGGAQGLGLAIARALAEHGAAIALVDVQADAVATAAGQLASECSRETLAQSCDVRRKDQVEACVARIVERFGRLDILVNNAGIHRRGTPTEYDPRDLEDVLAVNLIGSYHVVGAAGKVMIEQQR